MSIHRPVALLIVALLIASAPQATEAVPITFQTSSTVSTVSPALAGTFAPGNTRSLTYTFESTTPPAFVSYNTGHTSEGPTPPPPRATVESAEFNALISLSFTINGYTASSTGAYGIRLHERSGHHEYSVLSHANDGLTGPPVGSKALDYSMLFLSNDGDWDPEGTPLDLPADSVLLNVPHHRTFWILFRDASASSLVSGTVGNLRRVPAPDTLLLLGSGLAGLLALYRGRQRRR